MRMCDPSWQKETTKTLKNGTTKTTVAYMGPFGEAERKLEEWVLGPGSGPAVIGRLLHAVLAARLADQDAAPGKDRCGWHDPTGYAGLCHSTANEAVDALIDGKLPERLAKCQIENRRWRSDLDAEVPRPSIRDEDARGGERWPQPRPPR